MITNIPPGDSLQGVRKAAILLVVLGEESSAELLNQMTEDEVRKLTHEVARVLSVTGEQSTKVLAEFYQMAVARQYANQGGLSFAKKMLQKAFGSDESRRMVEFLVKSMGDTTATFDSLQKTDPQQLARFIHNEHPQTIALIISHLVPTQAAALLSSLPQDIRADVVQRMASLEQISPEIVAKIAGVISNKLLSIGGFSREAYGGVRAVAEICNRMDGNTSKALLDEIEELDQHLAETIRNLMFVFEDILMLNEAAMNEVIARIDRKILVTALKGTSDQLKEHFTKRMSSRAREMMLEDLDALGPVKIKDVEAAQQQVINNIRQLEHQGVISMQNSVGEQYVV